MIYLYIFYIYMSIYVDIFYYIIHTWLSGKSSNLNLKWGFSSKPRLRTFQRDLLGTYAPRTISARGQRCAVRLSPWSGICWRWFFMFPMGYPLLGEDMCVYIYIYINWDMFRNNNNNNDNNNNVYIYIIYTDISSPSSGYPLSSINGHGTSNGHMCLLFSEGFLSKSQLYVEPTKTGFVWDLTN